MAGDENDDYFEPDRERAHPVALRLLVEDFIWDTLDDNSPFGNDVGADALAELFEFLKNRETVSLMHFVKEMWKQWGVSNRDLELVDESKIQKLVVKGDHGLDFCMRDSSLIAIGIGQIMIEGLIDPEVRRLAIVAAQRQQLSVFTKDWTDSVERLERLKILENIFRALPS